MAGDSVATSPGDPSGRVPRGRRLDAASKVRRDRSLVSDRNRGLTWQEIARRHDLQERQCRAIYREWREAEKEELPGRDPVAWLEETLDRYEAIISDLALTAESADNSAARVGALRAQMDALARQTELLVASGLLPRNLRVIKYETDMRRVAQAILRVLAEHDLEAEVLRDIQHALRSPAELTARA